MKSGILILIIGCISNLASGQTDFCKEFKTGVFQYPGRNGGVYTIMRTDTNQFEMNSKQAKHAYQKIKWVNNCQYILYNRTEYLREKQILKDTAPKELYNIIYKFEQPDKFFVKTCFSDSRDTIKTIFRKLDTSDCYNYLFQRAGFSEYKNSKTYGQIRLREIYSINFYESNKTRNKYLVTFETTFHGEKLNWSKLLDSITIVIDSGQKITPLNCRFKGEYDDEILAVYFSTAQDKEAQIIRAFRCNRESGKIEPVDIKLVQYKEIDRDR